MAKKVQLPPTEMGPPEQYIPCHVRYPVGQEVEAAKTAIAENPANAPNLNGFARSGETIEPLHAAMITQKYWGSAGVKLSVQFMDTNDSSLKNRILSHMNAWSERGNIQFSLTNSQGDVRITRTPGQGYYSYLGTDIRHIPFNQNTMNLDSFSLNTSEDEYKRVVRHETGHTLGFPHEHMRKEIVARLDPNKTTLYFEQTQGWSAQEVLQQVLTPIREEDIRPPNRPDLAPTTPDQMSIMCYQLPGFITIDGQPIIGGVDIDETDWTLVVRAYPKVVIPSVPPTPSSGSVPAFMVLLDAAGNPISKFRLQA